MTESIRQETYLPHPPEQVWRALTDRAPIERWLMPNDFEPRVGHRFTFKTQPIPAINFDGIVHCEVLEVDPPRRLSYAWKGGQLNTTVCYRLEPEGEGTRLYLEHSGFDLSNQANEFAYNGMRNGWKKICEEGLPGVLGEMATARS